jgi:acyl-CoA thioesterase I
VKTSLLLVLAFALAAHADEPIRVACLGDSLTYGAKTNPATESHPAVLQQMLGPKFVVKNFGVGGASMMRRGKPTAFAQLPKAKEFAPNIAIVAFGTNDTRSRGVDYWDHIAEFVPDATALLNELASLPTKPRILLCLPPAHFAELPGMAAERKEINAERIPRMTEVRAKLRELAVKFADKKVTLVDLEAPTHTQPKLYDVDGVHMTAAGYRLLAETLRPFVER